MSVEHFTALVCAWLATYFIHSTLMLGGVWVVTRRLASRFDEIAELMWRTALVLPILTSLSQQSFSSSFAVGSATVGAIEYTPPALATSRISMGVWIGVVTIWVLGAALGVVRLYWCHRTLRRQIGHKTPLSSENLELLAGVEGLNRARISLVSDLAIPFALSRDVCVPAWVIDRLTTAELRAVVAHELAHVRRRDSFRRSSDSAVVRSFFFQPFNWLALTRLRELSECICDDEALAATKSPIPLVTALEAVAKQIHRRRAPLSLAPAMGAPISLTLRRVERILSRPYASRNRSNVGHVPIAGAAVVAGVLAILLAPRVTLPNIAFMRYTINAVDPAGPFTVTLDKGRIVGATMGGRRLDRRELRQSGSNLELVEHDSVLSLSMTREGGIKWTARKRIGPHQ